MSRRITIRVAAAILLLCLSAAWPAQPARADLTISAAPSLLEVSATPGGVGAQEITVTNAGSEQFRVNAEPVQYKGGDGALSAVSWLRVEPASFELAPGQKRAVKVTVTIPTGVESGGRFAMIAFRTGEKPGEGSAVGVAAQVGVPFLITVKGSSALALQPIVSDVMAVLEPGGQLGFRAAVENRGNTHFYARGLVTFSDTSGNPWGRLTLRDSTAILPGARELLYSDQSIPFKEGELYKARAEISLAEGSPVVREINFRATAGLEIADVAPSSGSTGEMDVRVRLRNSGALGLLPRIPMAIRSEDGKLVGVLTPDGQQLIWPGQNLDVSAKYPGRLPPGRYTLVVRAEFGVSSVQVEKQFDVSASGGSAGASVPVTKWAAAPSIQAPGVATPAPAPAPVVAPSESPTLWAAASNALLPLGLISLAAVAALGFAAAQKRRRRRPAPAVRVRSWPALPSPITFSVGLADRFGRRRKSRPSRGKLTALLPPAPMLMLPSPTGIAAADESIEWLSVDRVASFPWPEHVSEKPEDKRSATWNPPPEPIPLPSRATAGDSTERKASSGLSRAVAEKAATLVAEAGTAAQLGDRAAVDRLSRQALKLDPWNVDAWLWLAASCEDRRSSLMCLEAALLLNPSNPRAKRGFAALSSSSPGKGTSDSRLWEVVVDGRYGESGPVHHGTN